MKVTLGNQEPQYSVIPYFWNQALLGFYFLDHPDHDRNNLILITELPSFEIKYNCGKTEMYTQEVS